MIRTKTELEITATDSDEKYMREHTPAEMAERDRLYDIALELIPLLALHPPQLRVIHTWYRGWIYPPIEATYLVMNRGRYDEWRSRAGGRVVLTPPDTLNEGCYSHPNGNATYILISPRIPDDVILSASRIAEVDILYINYLS